MRSRRWSLVPRCIERFESARDIGFILRRHVWAEAGRNVEDIVRRQAGEDLDAIEFGRSLRQLTHRHYKLSLVTVACRAWAL